MAERPAASGSGSPAVHVPQIIGRLGLYATFAAAALLLVAIGGDLDVLALRAPLVGWLALLIGAGPLVALLLSTLASYINYYGVWRILRGKDEFDASEDLKSHAADVPQAVQAMLAGRAGCVPAVSTLVLCLSLLLALATGLPTETPFIGELGTWQAHIVASPSATPIPMPTATATAIPTPTAIPSPTPKPTPTPSPTPIPVIIKFSISPTTASWVCQTQGFTPKQTITLDNSGSDVSVKWQATAVETILGLNGGPSPWATLSGGSGTIAAHGKQALTVTAVKDEVCRLSPNGKSWHVSVVVANVGKYTFTFDIS